MDFKKLCVVGLGYIGLPTAATFAMNGLEVLGVDVNKRVVDSLNEGKIIIEEPDLDTMVLKAVESGRLRASVKPDYADVFIISVPTPITKDKKADMTYVKAATESIVPYLKTGNVVILESTSPTGTVEELMCPILEKSGLKLGEELFVGHSPERVLPGQILKELIYNNRIIGGINTISAEKIRDLYSVFVKGEIYLTTATTAEMCKMMENTFRDVNIALANELAKLCENLNINAWEVIQLCNKHPRVNIHQPGPGVGGHCLAVDPWFIVEKDPETAKIIELARKTNDSMPEHVLHRLKEIKKDNNIKDDIKVTILGITYKPDIDDMRESPVMELIELLEEEKFQVSVYDPHVEGYNKNEKTIADACENSDVLVLAVNHSEFKKLPLESIYGVMRNKLIFDTRNFINKETAEGFGFKYYLLGSK
jgi:UDP-N-acetyl-D-mannosaminuronic acid dehydrogenase